MSINLEIVMALPVLAVNRVIINVNITQELDIDIDVTKVKKIYFANLPKICCIAVMHQRYNTCLASN